MKSLSASASAFLLLPLFAASAALAQDAKSLPGLHDDSELGIVITGGNSETQSYNFKQLNTYGWGLNLLTFNARFLQTDSLGLQTAQNWGLSLRYERQVSDRFSGYLGEGLESDRFSGYFQRYNTDVGGKYSIIQEELLYWNAEFGYRYTIENRTTAQVNQSYLRIYTEANRAWTKTFSTKLWVEYLPNLSDSSDFQLNSELSGSAAINEIFAIKAGYRVNYRNILLPPATKNTDTQFTTALVAKF